MPKLCFSHLIIFFFIFFQLRIEAQIEANHWYFGSYAGINFNSGEPEVQSSGQIDSWEGISSISSSTGDLLFYTDGIYVFDRNHELMPNGTGLLGDPSSTQSAIIIPIPGSNLMYYIFTIDDVDQVGGYNGLKYSKIDMQLNNELGDIVGNEKNKNITNYFCEKISAVRHSNGLDIWVISQKWGTNEFYSYLVTNDGINESPVVSNAGIVIGGDGVNIDVAKGYLRVSPDGTKLAKANAGLKSIEIFDFNDSTGIVSNGIIDTYLGCEPYGIEFSPNSKLLYVNSWKSNPSMILYQYDLQADDIIGSRLQISSGLNGALQLAPDFRIYIAQAQSPFLGRINQPNKAGLDCDVEESIVYLKEGMCHWGLPNFISFGSDTIVDIKPLRELKTKVLNVIPNPVYDKLTISIVGSGTKEIMFYSGRGVLVDVVSVEGVEQKIIDASDWQSGLYVAVMKEEGKVVAKKKFLVK